MSYTNKVALFKALVNGDIDAVKGCSDDVDFNNYFTIGMENNPILLLFQKKKKVTFQCTFISL